MSIKENLDKIRSQIPSHVKLVAVSKTKPNELIQEALENGQLIFGENKVQDLTKKHEELSKDIQWHYIGHLQTNKVKYIAPFIDMIHGVDSIRLLKQINKEAAKNNRIIKCLLQFHIADEISKFGLNFEDAVQILESPEFTELQNVNICGVMGMATFTSDTSKIRLEFAKLRGYFEKLKDGYFNDNDNFSEISMGMSHDFLIAIEEGSTMIRIGTSIFGQRNY